jgi:hypothetical protein
MDLAEKQMLEGTASSQVITHWLKMGTGREKLERERLENENKLLTSKVEQLASAKRTEELYAEALKAMRTYAGQEPEEIEYYGDEQDVYGDQDVY